jgi:hypothetical protein
VGATLFDLAAERLEHHTSFSNIESRGTLRIALKSAGLTPKSLSLDELRVVFDKVMPAELEARGVRTAAAVCSSVMSDLAELTHPDDAGRAENVDDVFRRLSSA